MSDVLDKLRQFDTATVANVIELFELRPRNTGFMLRRIQAAFPDLPPMAGYAATVTCRTFVAPDGLNQTSVADLIARFDDLSGAPVVVMQNLDAGGSAACFGDVMCTSFQAFGAQGLITDGPGRDLAGIKPLRFPVFFDGIVCAHGYNHLCHAQIPVQVGGISVVPDTLLHADANGVTTVPKTVAADVADACADFAAAEKVILDLGKAQSPALSDLRDAYAEKARLLDALGKRVRVKHLS